MPFVFAVPAAIAALLALTASCAAVFRVSRCKEALTVAERAAVAWKEERDAAVVKANRLEEQVNELDARVLELETAKARLEQETNLTRYFDQQAENHKEVVAELHTVSDGFKTLATSIEVLAVMLRPLTAAT